MVTVVGIGEKLDFEGEIGHLISDNNLKEAKELVMIALDKVPNDIIRLCQYITILIKEKNYIEAERITLDLYNKYPDNFIIKGLLINIYTGLGKTVEAKKLVDEKTASETENDINDEIRAKQNIDILMHDKQYTEAEMTSKIALERFPNNIHIVLRLITSLIKQNDYSKLEEAYFYAKETLENLKYEIDITKERIEKFRTKISNINPLEKKLNDLYTSDRYMRGEMLTILFKMKLYREGESIGVESIKLYPNDEFIKGRLIDIYIRIKKLDEAEALIRSSYNLPLEAYKNGFQKQHNESIRNHQLEVILALKREEGLENEFLSKENAPKQSKSNFFNTLRIIYDTDDLTSIIQELKQKVKENPNDLESTFLLIQAYHKNNNNKADNMTLAICKSAINNPNISENELKIFKQLLNLLKANKMLVNLKREKTTALANAMVKEKKNKNEMK